MAGRHTAEGIAGADFGDRAFIAIDAPIVAHLEKERAVAKSVATFNALRTPDAQLLVNGVLVIRILHIRALNCGSGTQAILRAGVEIVRLRLEIAGAKLAIPAHREGVHALHGRLFQNAVGRTVATAKTFLRINLPHRSVG